LAYGPTRHDITDLLEAARRAHDDASTALQDREGGIELLQARLDARQQALYDLGRAVLEAYTEGEEHLSLAVPVPDTEQGPQGSGDASSSAGLDEPPPVIDGLRNGPPDSTETPVASLEEDADTEDAAVDSSARAPDASPGPSPRPPHHASARVVRVPEPIVERKPASIAELQRLAGGLGPNWQRDDSRKKGQAVLLEALETIGKPVAIGTPNLFFAEVDRLARATDGTSAWTVMPSTDQRELLTLAVAKARYLQDEVDRNIRSDASQIRLEQTFPMLTRYSATERPGYVHGLSRRHHPEGAPTWFGVAEKTWDELARRSGLESEAAPKEVNPERALEALQAELVPGLKAAAVAEAFAEALEGGVRPTDPRIVRLGVHYIDALIEDPRLKALRRAVRDASAAGEEVDDPDEGSAPSDVPDDWPWMPHTLNQRVVIVGGDSREEAAQRIKDAFRAKTVEWESDGMGRRLDAITARIRNRTVDVIIFLARFGTHRAQGELLDACKAAGVPFIRIERGYGVAQVRLAIEHCMLPAF
jgi:hypothetical protein